ncbi:hypothetical protein DPMN_083251 [Dreissena polymorpha]|uniref:HEAT repeat-containing protein 1 n=1 Tax=Dreissena polymorpha TaxID=45954 RepID=A0A9D3YCA6_DREPO|nr:hypothetical protein DPMN_083251 [Dreissena polymorpha]
MDVIVSCIRSSDNPQTHHHAFILLTAAAKIYPVSMRHPQTHHHALILLTAAAKIYPVSMRQPPDPPPCPHTAHCSS